MARWKARAPSLRRAEDRTLRGVAGPGIIRVVKAARRKR